MGRNDTERSDRNRAACLACDTDCACAFCGATCDGHGGDCGGSECPECGRMPEGFRHDLDAAYERELEKADHDLDMDRDADDYLMEVF